MKPLTTALAPEKWLTVRELLANPSDDFVAIAKKFAKLIGGEDGSRVVAVLEKVPQRLHASPNVQEEFYAGAAAALKEVDSIVDHLRSTPTS